jgi:fructoselysine transporter
LATLIRGLNLRQATAINMIDMVGIGPFVTLSFVMGALHSPYCILAWLLGALLAWADGSVWAELGARWPDAGGSYVFLQRLYGERWGRLMAFLYVWQTSIQAPLVVASGAIGFAQYAAYLYPLDTLQQKLLSGSIVLLVTLLLYRHIVTIGRVSVVMGVIVIATILWIIATGAIHFDPHIAWGDGTGRFDSISLLMVAVGQASVKTIYSYLGYYNVCHLGGEITQPQRNIPRSIFISILGISLLYLGMQVAVMGVVPWQDAKTSEHLISTFFEQTLGREAAVVVTVLILFIAITSLFAVMLGYSRVPYAAAIDGNYFAAFGKLHSKYSFPYISLLVLGGLAFVFSLLFKMKEVITAIIVMRILVQFVGQAIGLIAYRKRHGSAGFPFKMPLYPLPAILSIIVWMFVFISVEPRYIGYALGVIGLGFILFIGLAIRADSWHPFRPSDEAS